MYNRLYNFSAGPSVLPEVVLEQVRDNLLNYEGAGMSVMEMSHRSAVYESIISAAEVDLRQILCLDDSFEVLFLQGGASLQFSMVPMNLYISGSPVDVIHTGVWAGKAIDELKKCAPYQIVASGESDKFCKLPVLSPALFNANASYVYMTSNNTIHGTQWSSFPTTGNVPLVVDMSSDILSRELDMSQFGLIFAGAQKNLGPSGVTVVIIKKDLLERSSDILPTMLNYRTHAKNKSMYNTPPAFGIYVLGLVLKWMQAQGGLSAIEKRNEEKAAMLYEMIDNSAFYLCPNDVASRSRMNIVFNVKGGDEALEKTFVQEAVKSGLLELKGHRSAGGLRASLYNAQPVEGVVALVQFMKEFEQRYR
jgi:phosphoserine aminotransferase